jgi:hypothetical protein
VCTTKNYRWIPPYYLKKYSVGFNEDLINKFNFIRGNAQLIGQLIDDIQTLSRLSSEKMSLTPANMDEIVNVVWRDWRWAFYRIVHYQ